MQRKLNLLGRAAKAGWAWAWDYSDHIGRVLTLLALFVGFGGVSAAQVGWWGPAAGVVAFGVFALFVGALRGWDEAESRIESDDRFQQIMGDFQQHCFDHCHAVERLLDARKMAGPPPQTDFFTKALREETRAEAQQEPAVIAQHERETVAVFMESELLDRGVRLFDQLVEGGFVVDTNRPQVAAPRSPMQIWEGMDTIRTAAERIPVYR